MVLARYPHYATFPLPNGPISSTAKQQVNLVCPPDLFKWHFPHLRSSPITRRLLHQQPAHYWDLQQRKIIACMQCLRFCYIKRLNLPAMVSEPANPGTNTESAKCSARKCSKMSSSRNLGKKNLQEGKGKKCLLFYLVYIFVFMETVKLPLYEIVLLII